jgi:hypothetical protein
LTSISNPPAISEARAGGSTSLARMALPVLIVAGVLAIAIGFNLARYHGNLTGFVEFGSRFVAATHPPAGAIVDSPRGYDGQFFYLQARDPLLLHDSTIAAIRGTGQGFRLQRVGYPAVAYLLAGGNDHAIPFALLAVNVIVLLSLTIGLACYLRRRGRSPNWAIAVALAPGMLLPTMRDLCDPLAIAATLTGLLLWRSGRRWPAALALTVAVLTREVMVIAVVAVALHAAVVAFRGHSWRASAARVWPVVVLPLAVFAAWQSYLLVRYGGPLGDATLQPLSNLVAEVRGDLRSGLPFETGFDFVYIGLMLAAVIVAVLSVRRKLTVLNAAALALTLGILLPTLGDVWSDTRLSAPMFALLLLDGLERRDRRAIMIGTAAAAMSLLVPFAIPGAF